MKMIGNLIWFLFGGVWLGLEWMIIGTLWCISIIGIPIGIPCFRFASLAFFPFGKEIEYGTGNLSLLANALWILFGGLPLALAAFFHGICFCVTIVGIPFGLQCFKLAKFALLPFGAKIS